MEAIAAIILLILSILALMLITLKKFATFRANTHLCINKNLFLLFVFDEDCLMYVFYRSDPIASILNLLFYFFLKYKSQFTAIQTSDV